MFNKLYLVSIYTQTNN